MLSATSIHDCFLASESKILQDFAPAKDGTENASSPQHGLLWFTLPVNGNANSGDYTVNDLAYSEHIKLKLGNSTETHGSHEDNIFKNVTAEEDHLVVSSIHLMWAVQS